MLRRHHRSVISTRSSTHRLRRASLHYERKHSVLQLAYSEAGWETVRHAPPSTDAHVDCTRWQVKARRLNTVRASSDRHETVVIQTPAWCHLEFETQHNLHNTTFSIGRDESNDLVYDNQHISNMHCMLTRGASGAPPVLKDTSTNGILVDGLRVCKGAAVQLTWGQRVELINFGLIVLLSKRRATPLRPPREILVRCRYQKHNTTTTCSVHISSELPTPPSESCPACIVGVRRGNPD